LNNNFNNKRHLNLPNIITSARILLVPVFLYFLARDDIIIAIGVLVLASITDMLDGFIARRWRLRTELGSYLDPAADKLLFLSTFVIFTIKGEIPVWFTVIIIFRDILIVSGSFYFRWRSADFKIQPTRAGKWSVFFQIWILACVLIKKLLPATNMVINRIFEPLIYFTLFLSLFSGFQYVRRGVRMLKEKYVASGRQ
jgi:CDP-diacylglycerol--glycerol-3-phosphate 3-phosphatidyltransferase